MLVTTHTVRRVANVSGEFAIYNAIQLGNRNFQSESMGGDSGLLPPS